MHRYTDEQLEYLREIAEGRTREEIQELFNSKFNAAVTLGSLRSTMSRRGIRSNMQGYRTRYAKEHKLWNTGKKGICISGEATQFKRGNLPPTHLQVGSEAEREGIILVKTAEPNIWMRKHIMVWEMHHGTVPDGYVVSFKDGDKLNCVIDNLFLVSRGAFTSVAKRGLRNEHPGINYSVHLLTELELAIRRKEGSL